MKHNSALIDLIRTLQPGELEELRVFVQNPVPVSVQSTQPTLQLYAAIAAAAPGFSAENLTKERLYAALYPGESWVEGRLKKAMIALHKQVQAFLLIRHYFQEENTVQQQMDLCAVFQKRGLKSRYEQMLRKAADSLETALEKDAEYYRLKFRIDLARNNEALAKNQTRTDLPIPQMLQNLAVSYHINRLEILNFFLNQQKLTQVDAVGPVRYALQETVPGDYLDASGDLFIQQRMYEFLTQDQLSPDAFRDLNRAILQREPTISPGTLRNAYTMLRNVCQQLIYSGHKEYLEVLHELLRDNLERGYLYYPETDQKITPGAFLNLVNVGLLTRQYAWVRDFLASHREAILGDNETGDYYRLNYASYLFAIGEYEAALDSLPPAFSNISYQLIARRLEIKVFYELQSELLEFKLDAFKMYISRASRKFLSRELRGRNADFANLLAQILQSTPGDAGRKEQLLKRIRERVWAAERDWLLEKVQALA